MVGGKASDAIGEKKNGGASSAHTGGRSQVCRGGVSDRTAGSVGERGERGEEDSAEGSRDKKKKRKILNHRPAQPESLLPPGCGLSGSETVKFNHCSDCDLMTSLTILCPPVTVYIMLLLNHLREKTEKINQ